MKYFIIALVFILMGCNNAEVIKVDVKDVDPKVLNLSNRIADRFFSMSKNDSTWFSFKDLDFVSPGLHLFFMKGSPYVAAPMIVASNLGEVYSHKLYQVYYYKGEKYFRYRVKCEMQKSPVEFRVRINSNNTLNRFYLFVKESSGPKKDLFMNETFGMKF